MVYLAAIDLGASSGRVVVGDVSADRVDLHEVARFANEPVQLPSGLHWDPVELYRHSLDGLFTAVSQSPEPLASVAVDAWAVDYGLLRGSQLLGQPFHYRDERTAAGVERVHRTVPFDRLYQRTGLQFLPFNTLYQLAIDELLPMADRALLIPDLIGYWLTGEQVTEQTNASTTGLLNPLTGDWDTELIAELGLPLQVLAPVRAPGSLLGTVTSQVGTRIGAPGLPVHLVGSHDTASAVVGVPMTSPNAAYISCGTWGLVGVELAVPVVTEASRAANFTNEGGVDGRIRFLTNVMGTWLLSQTLITWQREGGEADLSRLLIAAAQVGAGVPLFDVQDPRFVPPGDMPSRIGEWCTEHGVAAPVDRPVVVRSIVESLAQGFADALAAAQELSGLRIDTVHIVGGGALNTLLCQSVANRSGRTVLAGPVEATAIGNLLVQARAVGAITGTLEDLRDLIARTHQLKEYRSAKDHS